MDMFSFAEGDDESDALFKGDALQAKSMIKSKKSSSTAASSTPSYVDDFDEVSLFNPGESSGGQPTTDSESTNSTGETPTGGFLSSQQSATGYGDEDGEQEEEEQLSFKDRLVDLYMKFNPSMLPKVDETLKKYKGTEKKLFDLLWAKYPKAERFTIKETKQNEEKKINWKKRTKRLQQDID